MLWLKALHIIAMVTWFAGLFYLPRLFVYHAVALDRPSIDRFQIMERRLFIIMSIGALATLVFGASLVVKSPAYLSMGWLQAKFFVVVILIGYHIACYQLMRRFARNQNTHGAKWYRGFNEIPSVLLVIIVMLAVVKPF